ncbi:UNVERIFIED_CONTAM: hypothetical protein K2H54_021264 [Gekko kuhli]
MEHAVHALSTDSTRDALLRPHLGQGEVWFAPLSEIQQRKILIKIWSVAGALKTQRDESEKERHQIVESSPAPVETPLPARKTCPCGAPASHAPREACREKGATLEKNSHTAPVEERLVSLAHLPNGNKARMKNR